MLKLLVIGIGNPARGDDALGPRLIERLTERHLPAVELLTDYQLQIEYLLDLHARSAVIFVDASVTCQEPFEYSPVSARQDNSHSTHAMSPEAVLNAYAAHYRCTPPTACLLAIRGYSFALGDALSERAASNLDAAEAFVLGVLDGLIATITDPA